MKKTPLIIISYLLFFLSSTALAQEYPSMVFEAGHSSLQNWLLPNKPKTPKNNEMTPARVKLGKALFFDPRLSGDGNMSCATCHSPMFGWSDGLATAKGSKSRILGRASPVVTNTAFNHIQMWDGRKKSLEDQAMGPMMSNEEMNMDIASLLKFLKSNKEYSFMFKEAYQGEDISEITLAKAIASFERTIISNNSPFDEWVKGNENAMTKQQINGFKLFVDPDKGNCEVCHSAPNFTDNGFHNIGLASFGDKDADMGRYAQRPLGLMKGAFKTPTLRDIALSAPYFHDGSSKTLTSVIEHYQQGGKVKSNLSPNLKELKGFTENDREDLVAFLHALTSPQQEFTLPILPLEQ